MQYNSDDERLEGLKGDERIVMEARIRWQRCKEWQDQADKWWLDDTKFANADTRNHDQWPDDVWGQRTAPGEDRPCLTINKTRVHNRLLINESLKNKSAIKIRPTAGEASFQSAQAMQALIRRIENISRAQIAYRTAIRHQVEGGIGYVILETGYVSDRTFDQDIFIKPKRNPMLVYLDPDCWEDSLGANFGIEFEVMSRDKFNAEHPRFKDKVGTGAFPGFDIADNLWLNDNQIIVAIYHRRNGKKDKLISYELNGQNVSKLLSEIKQESGEEIAEQLIYDIENSRVDGRVREVTDQGVEWFQIAGDVIMKRGKWAGKYIPIIPCIGDQTVIEGVLDRKGLTRFLIDPQRMLNYNASASIEFGALQTKTPYIGPARAFEGQEQWKYANRKNYAFLQYNDVDEEADNPELAIITAPKKVDPPTAAPVYQQGMQDSERQMMMVSGQYQAQLGEEDQQSAASGRAINERQRQSETATYDFVEHQADMYRAIGIQLLDLIPKIYDTKRLLTVLDEKNEEFLIQIDPTAAAVYSEIKRDKDESAMYSLNPNMGEYQCISDPGPDYATQRQEAWNAISIILQQNMQLAAVIGDLLFKYGDFPGADDLMERMRKEIQATKPYLFDEGENPGVAAAQQQLQKLTQLNGELVTKLADMQLRLRGKEELRDIEAFKADTGRMDVIVKAIKDLMPTPAMRAQFEHEIGLDARQHVYDMIQQVNQPSVSGNGAGQ